MSFLEVVKLILGPIGTGVVVYFIVKLDKAADKKRVQTIDKIDDNTIITTSSAKDIEALKDRVGRQNGRIDKLEYWRDRHMEHIAGREHGQ